MQRLPSGKCCRREIDNSDSAAAKALAKEATTDFLNQLMADLRVRDPTEIGIRSFLGRDQSIAFLIDTTESMREELISIKSVISDFVARFEGNQLGRYILLAFGDSKVDTDSAIVTQLITPDPDALVNAVLNLNADADGADDCREAGFDVLERAP